MSDAPPWPGIDPVDETYHAQLRAISQLAIVAEEARQWIAQQGQYAKLPEVTAEVSQEMAIRWLEVCQDAYAASHQWGPACLVPGAGGGSHMHLVHAMVQAINRTISGATAYLGRSDAERYGDGSFASTKAPLALAYARALIR